MEALIDCMIQEIKLQQSYLQGQAIESIYFGGGTPSILPEALLRKIMENLRTTYAISANAEITLEANPDDLNAEKLKALRELGVNRLSIGIQSFQEDFLRGMNRAHSAQEALNAINLARKAGFDNLSADLMYGFPSADHAKWQHDLQIMLQQRPEHISAYCLTVEDKTALGRWTAQGKFHPASDEFAAEQFEMLVDALEADGYIHYEVSNFSLPKQESKHNSNYWQQVPYLGIGPGAHSFNGNSRQYNVSNNARYIKGLQEQQLPFESEILSRADRINEYLMTSLRTRWGCSLEYLKAQFDFDLLHLHSDYIHQCQVQGMMEKENNHLLLTRKGKLLADKISGDLFLDPDETAV